MKSKVFGAVSLKTYQRKQNAHRHDERCLKKEKQDSIKMKYPGFHASLAFPSILKYSPVFKK